MERRRALGALAGVVAWGALPDARALMVGEPPDSPSRRIDPNTPLSPFSGVGSVVVDSGGVFTGTLIARRYAVTAAHVVVDPVDRMRFDVNIDADRPLPIRIRRAVRHPQYAGFSAQRVEFDVAVLELDMPAPPEARRYPVYAGPIERGTRLQLVGYGASGTGSTGVTVPAAAAVKRQGSAIIQDLQPSLPSAAGTQPIGAPESSIAAKPGSYLFVFRDPRRPAADEASDPDGSGLASGDSGSPAFITLAGRMQLLGVNAFVARSPDLQGPAFGYGTIGGGAILARHLRWIWSVMRG